MIDVRRFARRVAIAAAAAVVLASATPAAAAPTLPLRRPVITLDGFTYGVLGLDGGTGGRFEAYWLAHGGPRVINLRRHPLATFTPPGCRYVYGTLCALAVDSLAAAAVADPGR